MLARKRKGDGVFVLALVASLLSACSNSTGFSPDTSTTSTIDNHHHRNLAPNYEIVYNFPQKNNAPANPAGPLYPAPGGNVYGTTLDYWVKGCGECGNGAVYAIDSSTGDESLIYLFGTGQSPQTGVVRGAEGNLYGTAPLGGAGSGSSCSSYGCGLVFKLTGSGSSWSESVVHSFSGGHGGAYPAGPPLLINGTLYGVTIGGGDKGMGIVYSLTNSGTFTVLHTFSSNSTGYYPEGPLTVDSNGTLWGTTTFGGAGPCDSDLGCGTVFSLNKDGSNFQVDYSFKGVNSNDAAEPEAGVTVTSGGNIVGTTASGGTTGCTIEGYNAAGCGAVFELIPNAIGAYGDSVIYDFPPDTDSSSPIPSGLLQVGTKLYGTTSNGGSCVNNLFPDGCGTIFSVTTAGTYTELHSFAGPPDDGAYPFAGVPVQLLLTKPPVPPFDSSADSAGGAGLAVDANGIIWGSTFNGGTGSCGSYGCGIVYKYTTNGSLKRRAK